MKLYMCYFEIHIEDRTFYEHVLVYANNPNEALDWLVSERGEHYHKQAKGCCGEFSEELAKKYMLLKLKPMTCRMDCGHDRDALRWNEDAKKYVCSACQAEAYATSYIGQAIERAKDRKPSLEELEDILNAGEEPPVIILENGEVQASPTKSEMLLSIADALAESLTKYVDICERDPDIHCSPMEESAKEALKNFSTFKTSGRMSWAKPEK